MRTAIEETRAAAARAGKPTAAYREEFSDSQVKGLKLRITGNGVASWSLFRRINGVPTRVTLGSGIAVEEARKLAAEAGGEVARGENPNQKKRERRAAAEKARVKGMTVQNVLDEYIQASPKLKPKTSAKYRADVERHLKDWLDTPVQALTRKAVKQRYNELAVESKAKADSVFKALRAAVRHHMDVHRDESDLPILTANPLTSLPKGWGQSTAKTRYVTPDRLRAWAAAVKNAPDPWNDVWWCCLLLGARLNEILPMTWKQLDVQAGVLTIKDTKGKRPLEQPIPSWLLARLRQRYTARGSSCYVFPSQVTTWRGRATKGYVTNAADSYKNLSKACGFDWTSHDLRRTFASMATRVGIPSGVTRTLVNHAPPATDVLSKHYTQVPLDVKLNALEQISAAILEAANVQRGGSAHLRVVAPP
ncbi:integrase family protein [Cupriavidus sp. SW-Y-13]|uniref:tyrosine-type recombinase/integrase n=1 Tax=Cupriavidus sp. SW-Y-13 TaxID=2653854 RepID=UPI001366038B